MTIDLKSSKVLLIVALVVIFACSGAALGDQEPTAKASLPVVGTLEKLQALLEQINDDVVYYQSDTVKESAVPLPSAAPQDSGKNSGAASSAQEYSATNVQVEGVDEADIVKTDGEYIYQVDNRRIVISKVYPADNMKIQKVIQFGDQTFSPLELYVDGSFLVLIGTGTNTIYQYEIEPGQFVEVFPPPSGSDRYVKAIVYDIRNKGNIKKVRELELEGDYVSSRKLGSALYLVANRGIDQYRIMDGEPDLPGYKDSLSGTETIQIGLDKIRYFPDCPSPNYLVVAGLNLGQPSKAPEVSSYLGSGENIYVSQSALYVAVSRSEYPVSKEVRGILPMPVSTNTTIYKFALNSGNVNYTASGKVPGTVLNQFSMDAYKGYLRVATTSGQIWRGDEGTSKNNVYILDGGMKITGKLENIAPGEKIYSARFIEGRAYLVTFKNVDPFFVIDVGSPRAPKVLGALKIPGYSNYLHPVDKNHVMGFGKDTVEEKQIGYNGQETSTAYYQGMKIALFDVTDVSRPVEEFKTVIGDRGTDSPLLYDHKALLFDKNKNLLAFPVTVAEVADKKAGATAYGQFTFQGAYIYSFSLEKGFELRGKITHLDNADYQNAGYSWYGSEKNIQRVLFIGDTLYTVSQAKIKANDLQTLAPKNQLKLQ